MAGMLRVPRTRGAFSGLLLVLLGIWGGLIAFVGPYFDYAYTPDRAWAFNSGRFWLSVVPGAAAVLGGLIVLLSANRAAGVIGAWLAALGGAWFVIGGPISTLWTADGSNAAGEPVGGTTAQALEQLGFFTGLGTAIVFFAAVALGRFTVVGVKEVAMAEHDAEAAEALRQSHAADREREAARTVDETPTLTTAPGTTTPTTYTGTTVTDEPAARESARAERRLDDHPDERLRPNAPSDDRPRATT